MAPIKDFYLLYDDQHRSDDEFLNVWARQENASVSLDSTFCAYRRNIISNPIDGFAIGAFSGIAEFWRSGSGLQSPSHPIPVIDGVRDDCSVHFLAEEHIIREGIGPVKFMSLLRRKPGISPAEFSEAWRNKHSSVVRSVPEVWNRFRGYRQNHIPSGGCRHLNGDEMQHPFDGIVEIWFDSIAELQATMMSDRYREVIRPDEETFVDLPNLRLFVTEHIVI